LALDWRIISIIQILVSIASFSQLTNTDFRTVAGFNPSIEQAAANAGSPLHHKKHVSMASH
jgi:hypothetical protein